MMLSIVLPFQMGTMKLEFVSFVFLGWLPLQLIVQVIGKYFQIIPAMLKISDF